MPRKKSEKTIDNNLEKPKKSIIKKIDFLYEVGRRKSAIARIRLYPNDENKGIIINQKKLEDYFPYFEYQKNIKEPLRVTGLENQFLFTIKVKGGGNRGQAEAIRHGIAKVLLKYNPDFRKVLKAKGYLIRDARIKERKKPGLKRARRAPQWHKR